MAPQEPKAEPATVEDEHLQSLLNKAVKVFQSNGTALTGTLLKFDQTGLLLTGKRAGDEPIFAYREKINAVRADK